MKLIARVISVFFHPLFVLYYIFLILHTILPAAFIYTGSKQGLAVHALVFGMSVFFPLVSTLSLRAAGLISSIRLEDKKDRIGPLISTILFYVWLFLNYTPFGIGPEVFNSTILGATIAISLSFLINNFSKISLHCIGMGGFVGAIGLYRLTIPEMSYKLELGNNMLELSPNLLLGFIIILAGLVGSARLYLKAHRSQDVFGGYLVGFLSQIVAFRILDSF